jgi:hypothetical protein
MSRNPYRIPFNSGFGATFRQRAVGDFGADCWDENG